MTVGATDPVFPPPLGSWASDAACADRGLLNAFYPPPGDNTLVGLPKQICTGCLVREECLAYALENKIEHGVWGGVSARGRRVLRKEQRPPKKERPILADVEHGTSYAYKKGCGCLPCKLAERRRKREVREEGQAGVEGVA